MNVPFLDLRPQYLELKDQFDEAYRRVAESGRFILGSEVESFESEFAAYCGVRHCVGVGNGLDALHLIIRALDIGPGDEVLVPDPIYDAYQSPIALFGGRAVPVTSVVRDGRFTIDLPALEAACTPRTRALLLNDPGILSAPPSLVRSLSRSSVLSSSAISCSLATKSTKR